VPCRRPGVAQPFLLGIMYISPNAQKQPLSPVVTIILGLVFLAVASLMGYLVFEGIKAGEIWRISKYNPGLVTRLEHPQQFWSIIISYSVIMLLNSTISVWFLVSSCRKLCR
jgi:hypothetical protein